MPGPPRMGPPLLSPRRLANVRLARGVWANTTRTHSATPDAMADAACSRYTSNTEPPVMVESVKRAVMPRNSASWMAFPLWQTPSMSLSDRPASSSASFTICASRARPVSSSSPVGDTASVTPAMAAFPRKVVIVIGGGSAGRGRAFGAVLGDLVVVLVVRTGVVGELELEQTGLAPLLAEMAIVGVEQAELAHVGHELGEEGVLEAGELVHVL